MSLSRGSIVHVLHVIGYTVDAEASNCTTGAVRLVGSGNGYEGRLEVCVNGAWGTVCSDGFDSDDASVACQSMEGFDRNGNACLCYTSHMHIMSLYG